MKKDFMTRLEHWARWMLPQQEADDIIADYRDIVSDPELLQGLGKPRTVIRPLAQKRPYHTWLAVFAVLAACILAIGLSPTALGMSFWGLLFDNWYFDFPYPIGPAVAVLATLAALVWFRWQGRKTGRLPIAIPILLAVFLAFIGGVMLFCWACSQDFEAFRTMWGTIKPLIGPNESTSASIYLSMCAMEYGSAIVSFLGLYGLVKARLGDRRWSAVYVLALAAMLTALMVLRGTSSMGLPADLSVEDFSRGMLAQSAVIAAVGVVGTGVALC